ncbi:MULTISPECIES: hypothetical protein [Roseivirga]|jgi:hypothetical protein|uniref:Phosphoribosylpyrophosphate synthetase n=1 Tax=Roseivirga spongicola TaxID=333140 RepID=A0A150XAD7_9BACT|nr:MULTISPECIES: hypothetical protein [Roseivirga]PWL29369.1 MAG: phosphoribosylpyrophosphate synthetase [Roseivirga sp. XM-24bin3]KYG75632.1 hypothetical protein AWW68_07290 [Roseivirga spongicola]MBO6494721.1 phosphoribosylpyrophosphate synthetase [Roseivirga sp.]MBO6662395.1 phosphoribosylpyrophosphate synthetase [Roseivirga sp.]MBO6762021.1 phosphoribosylpyrophosphate synthetase [Roseivirga sp.]
MMKTNEETLSQVMATLNERGYKEQFELTEDGVNALASKQKFKPTDLKIIKKYRFDGMTNPGDESTLYSLESKGGLKGTLVISGDVNSEEHQTVLNQIPEE